MSLPKEQTIAHTVKLSHVDAIRNRNSRHFQPIQALNFSQRGPADTDDRVHGWHQQLTINSNAMHPSIPVGRHINVAVNQSPACASTG
jgi:hypothetical protein